jgi:hypothetical protein
MYGLYTPILALQAFCLYHAYRNRAEQRWYWFILLFPAIGCGIYLYHHYYSSASISQLAEGVKEAVNTNYRIQQLEKALRLTSNVTNKINLADAYVVYQRFDDAINLYRETLVGFMEDDPTVRMKLLHALYMKGAYAAVIDLGEKLKDEKSFVGSMEQMMLAWAFHHTGKSQLAATMFERTDRSFTNYPQRLEYCKFLQLTGTPEILREKLGEILEEFQLMKSRERKMYREFRRQFEAMAETLNAPGK